MSSNTVNPGVRTGAAAYPEVPEGVDRLSVLPPELLTHILASLNPGPDIRALKCVKKELSGKLNEDAVRCMRFEKKTSATLQEIREILARNPGFSSQELVTLDLSRSNITDLELEGIVERFPKIKVLNVASCEALTDEGLKHLAHLKNLTSLNLAGCSRITDNGLQYLARLTNLTSLNLASCRGITDKGLQHLVLFLTNLTNLDLGWCSRITDNGVQHLALLTNLAFLILAGCSQITDNGLQYLGFLKNLQALNLVGCHQITNNGSQHLTAQYERNSASVPTIT